MSLVYPAALAALLAGIGVYGVLARRNAVLVLIGVELILNSANLLLVTAGSRSGVPFAAGPVLALFVITIAAAEVVVALAIILVMFRTFGHIDLTATPDLTDEPHRDEVEPEPEPGAAAPDGPDGPVGPGEGDGPGESDHRERRLTEGVS
ncbi:NADH-quinone oxidoreductase subunit NuoK [Intrasporangium sp.]|uniref:NADH-quinone oxidoreductase subunit NuoK n=1 Tax=Intrasporangium sp. TaxID=1925024 RepID=UPI00293B8FC2|nr:NADH-quinone oxidoreductase subunit NuoK [Intrasporangium sp.]